MKYLSLPRLSQELEAAVRAVASRVAVVDNRGIFNKAYNNTINPAVYEFAQAHELTELTNREYSAYFGETLIPVVGVMRNLSDEPAELPPHFDKLRKVAINYVLETGGDDVTTDLYDVTRDPEGDLSIGKNWRYHEVSLASSHVIRQQKWHVLDVQRAHAVHNIRTTRILFGVVLATNPSYKNFLDRFKDKL